MFRRISVKHRSFKHRSFNMSRRRKRHTKKNHKRKALSLRKYTTAIPRDDLYYPSTLEGQLQREKDEGVILYKWYKRKSEFMERSRIYYNMFVYNPSAHILLNGIELKGLKLGPDIEQILTDYIIMFLEADKKTEWDINNKYGDPYIESMYFIAARSRQFMKLT